MEDLENAKTVLTERWGGVDIASAAGLFNPAHMSAYNAAKAGVISLSDSMNYELTPFSIGTTVVCPSFFQTNLLENMKFTVAGMKSVDGIRIVHLSKL